MKDFLARTVAKWFKRLGFAGALRFKMLYWAYRLWPGLHIRHREWDFVLDYLPKLKPIQKVRVLDIGCSRTLFAHEIVRRGYELWGIDLEPYQEKFPGMFILHDIRDKFWTHPEMDFITCISVLEHIRKGRDIALKNMLDSLKVGGRLLLTIPTFEFAQGRDWIGFDYEDIEKMIEGKGKIIEYTERMGQMCLVIVRI